jgi:hypothetical protein
MAFDPRLPFEIHYLDQTGDDLVETVHDVVELRERAGRLITSGKAKAGTISFYEVSRKRVILDR